MALTERGRDSCRTTLSDAAAPTCCRDGATACWLDRLSYQPVADAGSGRWLGGWVVARESEPAWLMSVTAALLPSTRLCCLGGCLRAHRWPDPVPRARVR